MHFHRSTRNNQGNLSRQIAARGYPLCRWMVQLALYDYLQHRHLAEPRHEGLDKLQDDFCELSQFVIFLKMRLHFLLITLLQYSNLNIFQVWHIVGENLKLVTCLSFLPFSILGFLPEWLDETDCGTFVTCVPDGSNTSYIFYSVYLHTENNKIMSFSSST